MSKNRRYGKLHFKLIEFVVSPLWWFSEEYGKVVISISVVCICLFITRPMRNIIELPKAVEDTVGDIPVIEHYDDGDAEVFHETYRSYDYHPSYYPIAAGMIMFSGDTIFYDGGY